jgi:hypothetical protein
MSIGVLSTSTLLLPAHPSTPAVRCPGRSEAVSSDDGWTDAVGDGRSDVSARGPMPTLALCAAPALAAGFRQTRCTPHVSGLARRCPPAVGRAPGGCPPTAPTSLTDRRVAAHRSGGICRIRLSGVEFNAAPAGLGHALCAQGGLADKLAEEPVDERLVEPANKDGRLHCEGLEWAVTQNNAAGLLDLQRLHRRRRGRPGTPGVPRAHRLSTNRGRRRALGELRRGTATALRRR